MRKLHIIQGGIENGDKKWLEKAARDDLDSRSWVAPKTVAVGDEAVIYVTGYGFFATARVSSLPKPRDDWPNRYGCGLTSIKLIEPAISLAGIRRHIPALTWAHYPRSITTPSSEIAAEIRKLIRKRRRIGVSDLDEVTLSEANMDELRQAALLKARPTATERERKSINRIRSMAIRIYVLHRANGRCEGCDEPAPFQRADGSPYLEPHHTRQLSDEGPDHPKHVIGLCPNCHRKAHYSDNSKSFNATLIRRLRALEPG